MLFNIFVILNSFYQFFNFRVSSIISYWDIYYFDKVEFNATDSSSETMPPLQRSLPQMHKMPVITLSLTLSSSSLVYQPKISGTSYLLHPTIDVLKCSYPNIFSYTWSHSRNDRPGLSSIKRKGHWLRTYTILVSHH